MDGPKEKESDKVQSERGPLGTISCLPLELRYLIYSHLLVATPAAKSTWGPNSGISTSILGTCRQIHSEALPLLYNARHRICCDTALPTAHALSLMRHIELEVCFKTVNRADYEVFIDAPLSLYSACDKVGFWLQHNHVLEELSISLLNTNQRKRGPKPLRSEAVRSDMRRLLLPFATLPAGPVIRITGFDFLEWAELFDEMRDNFCGCELSTDTLLMCTF